MFRRQFARLAVVQRYHRAKITLWQAINCYSGKAGAFQRMEPVDVVFGGDKDQAFDPSLARHADIARLALHIIMGVIDNKAITGGVGEIFGGAGDGSKNWV